MPGRHVVKNFIEDGYYHIFNRGVEDRVIFKEPVDYEYFLELLRRYLSRESHNKYDSVSYESYAGRIELLAYSLTPSEFHLFCYLSNDSKAIPEFMRKISGAYTQYFNKKYNRRGTLFQGVYKASRIIEKDHLVHATRHLHKLPDNYYDWPYTSLQYYIGDWNSDWVLPDRIYKLYEWGTYESYLNDHEDHKIKHAAMQGFLADQ